MPIHFHPSSILFVCLGNICRSPLAEGVARHLMQQHDLDLRIDSCGTGGWHVGNPPCENSILVAKRNGIDISDLRARQVTRGDLMGFDAIVGMDDSNLGVLIGMGCERKKLFKLGDFGYEGADVPDPYYFKDFEGFEKVYTMVNTCTQKILEEFGYTL